MKRRFSGKANSTPSSDITPFHAIICHQGMTWLVTSM
jgi:hypothetical protein